MNQRRFEILIAVVFTIICYLGDYYLKESSVAGVLHHTLAWHALNILWLLSMVGIGYWGLKNHEIKWVKNLWILLNTIFFAVLLANKITEHVWQYTFIPEATSAVIRTPFFFLIVAYMPRWFMQRREPEKQ